LDAAVVVRVGGGEVVLDSVLATKTAISVLISVPLASLKPIQAYGVEFFRKEC